jgi:hypothetical protein
MQPNDRTGPRGRRGTIRVARLLDEDFEVDRRVTSPFGTTPARPAPAYRENYGVAQPLPTAEAYATATEAYAPATGVRPVQSAHRAQTLRVFPKGPKNYKRSDERIMEDACEALMHAHDLDSSDIEVTVKSGVVSLIGTVPEIDMKYHAEQLCERVPAVTDVINRIELRRPVRTA